MALSKKKVKVNNYIFRKSTPNLIILSRKTNRTQKVIYCLPVLFIAGYVIMICAFYRNGPVRAAPVIDKIKREFVGDDTVIAADDIDCRRFDLRRQGDRLELVL